MSNSPTRAAGKLTPRPDTVPYADNSYGNYVLGAEGGVTLPPDFVPSNDRAESHIKASIAAVQALRPSR